MANTSILAAFERMWQHTVALLANNSAIDAISNSDIDKLFIDIKGGVDR